MRRPATTRAADPTSPTRGPRPRSLSGVPACGLRPPAHRTVTRAPDAPSCTAPLTAEQQRHHHKTGQVRQRHATLHTSPRLNFLFFSTTVDFLFSLPQHLSTISYGNWRNVKRSCFYSSSNSAISLHKKNYLGNDAG